MSNRPGLGDEIFAYVLRERVLACVSASRGGFDESLDVEDTSAVQNEGRVFDSSAQRSQHSADSRQVGGLVHQAQESIS